MRKFWSVILCISIIGPFASGYVLVHLFQFFHYHHVQSLIKSDYLDSDLITLHFSESEFANLVWERANEFEWSGKMYDVRAVKATSSGFDVICWPDEKESRLLALHRSYSKRNMDGAPLSMQKKPQSTAFRVQLDLPRHCDLLNRKKMSLHSIPIYLGGTQQLFASEPPTPPPDRVI